jgi:2-dehydropantoate 2-reductase
MANLSIAIMGAGSVGCYLGGRLVASDQPVTLIARSHVRETLQQHGLRVSDLYGTDHYLPPDALTLSDDVAVLADADMVLVTVKSAATASVAEQIRPNLKEGAVVISLQNGLHNADRLRALLPDHSVLAGMVPYNIVNRGAGHFHQGSSGHLMMEAHPAATGMVDAFTRAGLTAMLSPDMPAVQWAKLLLNLNNAINALSGLPLKEELAQHGYRRCLALAQRETLALMARADIHPARITGLPTRWLPFALSLPDPLFRALGQKMLAIDPLARSSMWEDLEYGRPTEVDFINGEVVQLAAQLGHDAPANRQLVALVKAAERGGRRDWSAPELLRTLRSPHKN